MKIKANKQVLTKPNYWAAISPAARSGWQAKANRDNAAVCTHRPDVRANRGKDQVRRCSTGGRWGKSSDVVRLNVDGLLAQGYVWRTYITAAVALAAARDAVYSRDEVSL